MERQGKGRPCSRENQLAYCFGLALSLSVALTVPPAGKSGSLGPLLRPPCSGCCPLRIILARSSHLQVLCSLQSNDALPLKDFLKSHLTRIFSYPSPLVHVRPWNASQLGLPVYVGLICFRIRWCLGQCFVLLSTRVPRQDQEGLLMQRRSELFIAWPVNIGDEVDPELAGQR